MAFARANGICGRCHTGDCALVPDLRSLLPHDTVIIKVPIDRESLPGFIIIELVEKGHNFAPRTNQDVLNLFRRVFGMVPYWEVVERAGLAWLAANRGAAYSGVDVETLPLSDNEKAKLIEALQ